jgi:hypothetical protein
LRLSTVHIFGETAFVSDFLEFMLGMVTTASSDLYLPILRLPLFGKMSGGSHAHQFIAAFRVTVIVMGIRIGSAAGFAVGSVGM